ncbi:unnamed protein product [Schistosoma curassoni]|uniref:Uncharacterized protein n=1 Tax=Schistosoma curassoni TaxID=6186 RepID=A0A183KRV0_9TREM|nr:unnamed protein product [Schistosoma curassoni]
MVFGGSRQETLDLGFLLLGNRQQGVPVILRELVLADGFDLVGCGSDYSVVTSLTVKLGDSRSNPHLHSVIRRQSLLESCGILVQ